MTLLDRVLRSDAMSAEVSEANHDLIPSSDASGKAKNDGDKTWVNELDGLLGRVSEDSTREIASLKDDFNGLQKKLENDLDRIKQDVAEYSELTQAVTELTAVLSENMEKVRRVSRQVHDFPRPSPSPSLAPDISDGDGREKRVGAVIE
jgi:methyl-accepting chemotaxis protein